MEFSALCCFYISKWFFGWCMDKISHIQQEMPSLQKITFSWRSKTTRDRTRCAFAPVVHMTRRAEILNVDHGRMLKTTTDNQTPCNRVLILNLIFVQLLKKLPRNNFAPCGTLSCLQEPATILYPKPANPIYILYQILFVVWFIYALSLYIIHPPKPGTCSAV